MKRVLVLIGSVLLVSPQAGAQQNPHLINGLIEERALQPLPSREAQHPFRLLTCPNYDVLVMDHLPYESEARNVGMITGLTLGTVSWTESTASLLAMFRDVYQQSLLTRVVSTIGLGVITPKILMFAGGGAIIAWGGYVVYHYGFFEPTYAVNNSFQCIQESGLSLMGRLRTGLRYTGIAISQAVLVYPIAFLSKVAALGTLVLNNRVVYPVLNWAVANRFEGEHQQKIAKAVQLVGVLFVEAGMIWGGIADRMTEAWAAAGRLNDIGFNFLWHREATVEDVQEAWSSFYNIFMGYDKEAPKKKRQKK